MDALTQVVKRRQMLTPVRVERLQHDVALEGVEGFGAHQFDLGLVGGIGLINDAAQHVVSSKRRFILEPFDNRHRQQQGRIEVVFQRRQLPLFLDAVDWHEAVEDVGDHALAHGGDRLGDVLGFNELAALAVDHLALVIGHVVVFEQLFADIEVTAFDLALRRFERTRHQRVLDRFAFGHLQALHDRLQPLAGKNAQQGVIQREVEARGARITLASGTAPQLVVDPP